MANVDGFEFEAPGPGTWEMDASHVTRPIFGVLKEVFPTAISAGMRITCESYGLPLDTLEARIVHGFPYMQPKPLAGPAGAKPPPQAVLKVIMKLAMWLHPKMRRRLATASTLFERKPWREEVKRWDEVVKPATIAAHAEVSRFDVHGAGDDELAAHLRRVRDHVLRVATQDHTFNMTYMLPLGDFLVHAHQWTGMPHAELLQIFRGTSDISGGDATERRRLVEALRADAAARALLESARPAKEIYQALTDHAGEVGEAMAAFRLIFGNGIAHGLDMALPTVDEEPSAVLAALRVSVRSGPRKTNGVNALEKRIRDRVPPEHHAAFDEMLGDAKLTYRIRDERHLYGAMPSFGIGRRVIAEVGRRLVARGVLGDFELAYFAETEELCGLLAGETPISERDLADRRHVRDTLDATRIPLRLGPEPPPPPPAEWFPKGGARRLMAGLQVFFEHANEGKPQGGEEVRGLAVSAGSYEGRARLCETPGDLERIEEGDILVAPTTTPAINVVLPMLGAIVTDRGGALCHAAIVTREFGIPGVVGTHSATKRIPDGARIRVDGDSGVARCCDDAGA